MSNIALYGIPNCDTVKKARTWLEKNGIAYTFHDFKKAGIERGLIDTWLRDVTWDVLVNRKGTTWRGLPDDRKASVTDNASATALMLESPSVIKRPVLHVDGRTHVGFDEENYRRVFQR
jgi:arsenate reductase